MDDFTLAANNAENNILTKLGDSAIETHNLVNILTDTMAVVGKYDKLSGRDKKEIVMSLVTQYMDETLINVVHDAVPQLIDTLIAVENKKLKFNTVKVISCFEGFFNRCDNTVRDVIHDR